MTADTYDVDDFLAHYGVKGMRWGVINEERLANRQVRRETKASKFEAKASAQQKRIDELMNTPVNFFTRHNNQSQTKKATKERDRALSDAEASRQGKMTSAQKKVLIGAAAVGVIVATAVTVSTIESGESNRMIEKGRAFLAGQKAPEFKKNSILAQNDLDVDDLMDKVVKGVNPRFGDFGTTNNCRRATFTYEMRRRGFDVTATRTSNASGQNAAGFLNATSPGQKIIGTGPFGLMTKAMREAQDVESGKTRTKPFSDLLRSKDHFVGLKKIMPGPDSDYDRAIFDHLAKQPNGARGELAVKWGIGGGHSMAWEIVKGKPVVFDTQTGQAFKDAAELKARGMPIVTAAIERLDNIELNSDYLLRWMRNARN